MPDVQSVDLAKAGLLLARLDRCDHGGASEQIATVLGPAMLDEIADLRAKLEQAYATIRAFVEPGGHAEPKTVLTITSDLLDVMRGREMTMSTSDGDKIRIRLFTADEFLAVHERACTNYGIAPSLTRERAADLVRPLPEPGVR